MSVITELEHAFLPLFREAAQQAIAEYPGFKFNVWSSSVGGSTAYQGHNLGLECIFPDAADHEADCVAVSVGLMHLTTEPKLCEASVEWGSGQHPEVRLELFERPVPFSREALQATAARLPELLATFRNALHAWSVRGVRA